MKDEFRMLKDEYRLEDGKVYAFYRIGHEWGRGGGRLSGPWQIL
jgi:hypothetical protein